MKLEAMRQEKEEANGKPRIGKRSPVPLVVSFQFLTLTKLYIMCTAKEKYFELHFFQGRQQRMALEPEDNTFLAGTLLNVRN